jgi:hypothetical protein
MGEGRITKGRVLIIIKINVYGCKFSNSVILCDQLCYSAGGNYCAYLAAQNKLCRWGLRCKGDDTYHLAT